MHHFFKDESLDFEAIRILGTAPYGGADMAKVLEAAGQIMGGDPRSWQQASAHVGRRRASAR
jgi:hypothetical protein